MSESATTDEGPWYRRQRRVTAVMNGVIVLALLIVGGLSYRAVQGGSTTPTSAGRTTIVDTGTVTATVSASGNIAASRTAEVNFAGDGGTVTHLYVRPGQHVRRGQRIAKVDPTSARESLQAAQIQLRTAEAGFETTTEGETSQERAQDAVSVQLSQLSVQSALASLHASRSAQAMDSQQSNAALSSAQRTLSNAESALKRAEQQYDANPSTTTQAAVAAAQQAVSADRSALAGAKDARASSTLQDKTNVASQELSVRTARAELRSIEAQIAVSREPARAGEIASAQASIDSARIGVRQARTALRETELRAPSSGTVAAVNGSVGQSSTSTSTGSASSSSSSSTSSSSSSASGFVTLTSTHTLEVTAEVAEADIADVKVGQPAVVTLSATDRDITGTVSGIATEETITNNVVEYPVTVRLKKTRGVRLGQTASVVVTTGSKANVVRVSSAALSTTAGRTTATVEESDGSTRVVDVQIGLAGDVETQILSGLTAGERVEIVSTGASSTNTFSFPGVRVGIGGRG